MLRRFEQFVIDSYFFSPDTGVALFRYCFDDDVRFEEEIDFSHGMGKKYEESVMNNLLFHLSLALGISYYKLYPTKTILVRSGFLDAKQSLFWQNFYLQGLGEFFFRNAIDPKGLAHFLSSSTFVIEKSHFPLGHKWLVPFGGGKDSLVTVELLRQSEETFSLLSFGQDYSLHKAAANIVGEQRLVIGRKLSQQLFMMNKQGYYNGHVPITGIIHFVSLVVAYLSGYQGILFSNERSADFGNTEWKGLIINHQRSKSGLFEQEMQRYVHDYIHDDIACKSALRQRTELRIVKEFCQYDQYFSVFSSCNRNFHIDGSHVSDRRCNQCPKCLSTYMLMRPFIDADAVMRIRGEELYANTALLSLFKDLWGIGGLKPFECVGEADEYQYATWYMIQNSSLDISNMPVLAFFTQNVVSSRTKDAWELLGKKLLKDYEFSSNLAFLFRV